METTEYYPEFLTATILEWKHLLKPDKYKDVIVGSLSYLVGEKRVKVFAFVVMPNHIHLVWQSINGHKPKDNQLSFMKFPLFDICNVELQIKRIYNPIIKGS